MRRMLIAGMLIAAVVSVVVGVAATASGRAGWAGLMSWGADSRPGRGITGAP